MRCATAIRLAVAACVLAGAGAARAADPPPGRLLEAPASCQVRDGPEGAWRAVDMKAPEIRPEQAIRCPRGGTLRLRLPGNLREISIPLAPDGEYLVPLGENTVPPPEQTRPGRSAAAPAGSLERRQGVKIAEVPPPPSAAAPAVAQATASASARLETCTRPLGVLRVTETAPISLSAQGAGKTAPSDLPAASALVREMAVRSGCFELADRTAVALQRERELAATGSTTTAANTSANRNPAPLVAYEMTPEVKVAQHSSSIGGIGGLFGKTGSAKAFDATTNLRVVDERSRVVLAWVESKAPAPSIDPGSAAFGKSAAVAGSGFDATPEGRSLAAGLLDNFNRVVVQLRDEGTYERASYVKREASVPSAASGAGPANASSPMLATPPAH